MPKAAVATQIGAPLEVLDVDLQAPKAGEVRVRLGASGVCHSDLSVLNGTLLSPLPSVLGHEGAGIIEELGQGVDNLKVGDHVVISWVPQDGTCYYCRHDQAELCETGSAAAMSGGLLDGTSRFSMGGHPLFQMAASGTFSEETVVPAIGAVKISDDIPPRRSNAPRRRAEDRRHVQSQGCARARHHGEAGPRVLVRLVERPARHPGTDPPL
jgi:Zn-dependent alcohol dehydrogenase